MRSCSTSGSSGSASRAADAELALRQRLQRVLLDPDRASGLRVHGATPAAVLVALFAGPAGEAHVVLTKRRDDLRRHAGEISFPGGRRDPEDPDLRATALREAHEEIGLDPDGVEILGALQPTPTIATGYAVYPFVGLIAPGQTWYPAEAEVDRVFEVTMQQLREGYGRRVLVRRGVPLRTDTYKIGEDVIWGATARMLADLMDRLETTAPPG